MIINMLFGVGLFVLALLLAGLSILYLDSYLLYAIFVYFLSWVFFLLGIRFVIPLFQKSEVKVRS